MHNFLVCACKSQDFVQSQNFFARSHDRTTARLRNSGFPPFSTRSHPSSNFTCSHPYSTFKKKSIFTPFYLLSPVFTHSHPFSLDFTGSHPFSTFNRKHFHPYFSCFHLFFHAMFFFFK